MLGKLFGKEKGNAVLAPLEGKVIPISEVNDPTFSEEILGKGVAIQPTGGRVVSPCDGEVGQMFDTGHAVTITAEDGAEILIHVGLDTVKLKGEHYTIHAKSGDKVKVGDLLMEFDKDKIAEAGYDTVTPIVICNADDYKDVKVVAGDSVSESDSLLLLQK